MTSLQHCVLTSTYFYFPKPPKSDILCDKNPIAVINLEAVAYSSYCNTVEWFWWDGGLSQWPTGFLQCFDAVGWVIWPVKIVPK